VNPGEVKAAWIIVAALLKLVAADRLIALEVLLLPVTLMVSVPLNAWSCAKVRPATLPPRRNAACAVGAYR
jgi:hypothetical protein